ncbi:MAG: hypothetical protein IKM72_10240 [Oscillospiraceae bacterium]|nr:hypothetical protein [Oscillospiraceae bacterium]
MQITNNQGDTYTISSVKAIFLDDNTFELFNINLLNGRKFEDEEYEISDEDNNTLPVILGYDYNSIYNIGDYIEADTFTFNGQGIFLVVGILAKDTIINLESDNKLNLNRYMILPAKSSKNINLSESNKRQYEIYTYMTCNGIIASKLSADDVQNMIINICDQIKISPAFYIKGASNQRSYKLNISVHELNQSFSMVFLSGYFLIFLILISYTINFINRNTKYYAIISAFKYSLNTVIIMAAFEYTIILFFSFSISYIITTLSMKYMSMQFYNCSLIIVLLVYILMIVTIIIVYNYKIRKIDIAEYIRKY